MFSVTGDIVTQLIIFSEKASNKKKKGPKPVSENNAAVANTSDESPEKEFPGKKKSKFVNLYTQDGQNKETVLLKGLFYFYEFIVNIFQFGTFFNINS